MTTTRIADIVAAIPFGDQGKRKYRTVGALLRNSDNDPSKGPGFLISLDAWFNPAGLPISDGGSVFLSCYHPKEVPASPPRDDYKPKLSKHPPFNGDEDDIPF